MNKKLLIALWLALPFAVQAAEDKKMTPQQSKMAQCNKDATAKNLTGDDRKKFMSECLKAKPAMTAQQAQQEKMKTCNAEAKTQPLKGDERKAFMKECLSHKPTA